MRAIRKSIGPSCGISRLEILFIIIILGVGGLCLLYFSRSCRFGSSDRAPAQGEKAISGNSGDDNFAVDTGDDIVSPENIDEWGIDKSEKTEPGENSEWV